MSGCSESFTLSTWLQVCSSSNFALAESFRSLLGPNNGRRSPVASHTRQDISLNEVKQAGPKKIPTYRAIVSISIGLPITQSVAEIPGRVPSSA